MMNNIDWETSQFKYSDILEQLLELCPSTTPQEAEKSGKDYPHKKEDHANAILASKMKSIRLKHRHAVDTGRRSGHGRVVLLYYELCERIWVDCAATTVPCKIETTQFYYHGTTFMLIVNLNHLTRTSTVLLHWRLN